MSIVQQLVVQNMRWSRSRVPTGVISQQGPAHVSHSVKAYTNLSAISFIMFGLRKGLSRYEFLYTKNLFQISFLNQDIVVPKYSCFKFLLGYCTFRALQAWLYRVRA